MSTIFGSLVEVPPTVNDGVLCSGVLITDDVDEVARILMDNCRGVSLDECRDVARSLLKLSGADMAFFKYEYDAKFSHKDTAVCECYWTGVNALFAPYNVV